jgi:hypothetical protein
MPEQIRLSGGPLGGETVDWPAGQTEIVVPATFEAGVAFVYRRVGASDQAVYAGLAS